MSRSVVLRALRDDTNLMSMIAGVYPNYTMDSAPNRRPFVILRWESQRLIPHVQRGPHRMTVWAHCPEELGVDFDLLDRILDRIRQILTDPHLEQTEGEDGSVFTTAKFTGSSGDLKDSGYNTITKNSGYEVLFRTA